MGVLQSLMEQIHQSKNERRRLSDGNEYKNETSAACGTCWGPLGQCGCNKNLGSATDPALSNALGQSIPGDAPPTQPRQPVAPQSCPEEPNWKMHRINAEQRP